MERNLKYLIIAVSKNKHPMVKRSYFMVMMVILLLIFAGLQWNDPDPLVWTITYLYAAVLCFIAYLNKLPLWLAVISSVLFSVTAIGLWPQVYKGVTGTMENNPEIESARESLGLLICAFFVVISFFLQPPK